MAQRAALEWRPTTERILTIPHCIRLCFCRRQSAELPMVGQMWYAVVITTTAATVKSSCDPDYEMIGPGVFRFEYYYLLKNGRLTDGPWDRRDWPTRQISNDSPIQPKIGLSQVEAIGVAIAVIDPAGRALINAAEPEQTCRSCLRLGLTSRSARGRGVGNQTKYIGIWKPSGRAYCGDPDPRRPARPVLA